MGKHTKLKPSKKAPPKAEPESLQATADGLLRRTVTHLQALLSAVEETLAAGEANPALARESASVARAMTALAAEIRQQERHGRDIVKAMGADERDRLIVEYVRALPQDRRNGLRKLLDELDASARVL